MRGQSAVEFLVTYGWAILVLVIILGLLFTSGIFSPSYLVSEECSLGPKLPCKFLLYNEDGTTKLALQVTNGFGYKIRVTKATLSMTDGTREFVPDLPAEGYAVESGANVVIKSEIIGYAAPKSAIEKINAVIEYYSCAPEVNPTCTAPDASAVHMISGRVIGRVI